MTKSKLSSLPSSESSDNETLQEAKPFIIGICGGSASGKTTLANKILEAVNHPDIVLLSMDSFYNELNEEELNKAIKKEYNFDCPDAFDFSILLKTLLRLKNGHEVQVPNYNFCTNSREDRWNTLKPAKVVIFEGILTFHDSQILSMLNMKIFVDADDDIRFARRLARDITCRGRDLNGVVKQYTTMVQPSYHRFIAPLKKHADIIIPRGGENSEVATCNIINYVRTKLTVRNALSNDSS